MTIRFAHVNLIAEDWRRLARFYGEVFGCVPLLPERSIAQPWLARVTGVEGAALDGVHLRLPGHGERGPTLELFSYRAPADAVARLPHRPGFGHIAFAVDDVAATLDRVLPSGGSLAGSVETVEVAAAGRLTLCYARDPEGNLIELQRWGAEPSPGA